MLKDFILQIFFSPLSRVSSHRANPFLRVDSDTCGQQEAGVSLLELSLILPMIAVLISGMIDCGVSLYKHPSLVTAARVGALTAARVEPVTSLPGDEIRLTAVLEACAELGRSGPLSSEYQVRVRSIQLPLLGGQSGESIEVTVSRKNNVHFDMSKMFVASHSATSVFRILTQIPPTPADSITTCP